MSKPRNRVALAGLTILLTALGSVAATGAQNNGSTTQPPAAPVAQPRLTQVEAAQAQQFGVLRRAQRADDGLQGRGVGPFGANLDLARSVDTPFGRVWIVPARGHICLRTHDSVGTVWGCGLTELAAAGEGVLTLSGEDPNGDVVVVGLAPDGVSRVTLHGADGDREATVSDNVYVAKAAGPRAVELAINGEQHRITLGS